jgi:hypothetical protein
MSLSPVPGAFAEGVMSPRRARALSVERPRPFLVERDEPAPSLPAVDKSTGAVRLVFDGLAKRPVFVAGVVAMAGVTGIGLFLGLMLGELFG